MSNQQSLDKCLQQANAICALEGYELTQDFAQLQQRIINQELTLEEAIQEIKRNAASL